MNKDVQATNKIFDYTLTKLNYLLIYVNKIWTPQSMATLSNYIFSIGKDLREMISQVVTMGQLCTWMQTCGKLQ